MNLTKIRGNTHYIPSNTNTGVYTYKNKNCLIIDTGMNNTAARKIENVLLSNNLHPKYIVNTHNHLDHSGGNNYLTENYPGCITYTSEKERLFMENNELFPYTFYGAVSTKDIAKSNKPIKVDYTLNYGTEKINDEKFEIISLKGHTLDQIGIVTPDKVCFLGDSLFSVDILNKYQLPFIYSVEDTLNSFEHIKEIDGDIFVLGHSDKLYSKDEVENLVDINIKWVNNISEEFLTILDQPYSREDLLQNILILNDMDYSNFNQYHIYFSSTAAFLTYLTNKGLVENHIENGKIYYYRK